MAKKPKLNNLDLILGAILQANGITITQIAERFRIARDTVRYNVALLEYRDKKIHHRQMGNTKVYYAN